MTDLGDVLRRPLAEVAAAAYREALRDLPRVTSRSGVVTAVDDSLTPPQVTVELDDPSGAVTYCQALITRPEVGARVLVQFVPPSGAFTLPFAVGVAVT